MLWELKLADGKRAEWEGETGEEAAKRYVDAVRRVDEDPPVVVAYREARSEKFGIWPWGGARIIQ